ncbi:unnamed protein product [Cylicocyclus nassatus]|uniref:Uncharacterized protein n=1 Tax=Cylicocyclus nassatus TaxID=53992 RepID=A0AA36DIE4_CYLNA|nr:unnamed protein product [Cylicocyclus nassatus]
MAGQGQSAAAVIAAASDEATQVFNNILLNLENLIATNRRRRMRSASTQPTTVTRSLSARSLTARTDLLEMPFHDTRATSVNTARSYYISTAEDNTSRYPTAASTSYLTNDSLHSSKPHFRTARDNSAFSDTSAGSTGSTAVSPMVDADFATAKNQTYRGRSPTLRVTTNSQTMTPRQAWSHVPIGSYSVIRPMGYRNSENVPPFAKNDQEGRASASTGLSPFPTESFGTITSDGASEISTAVSKSMSASVTTDEPTTNTNTTTTTTTAPVGESQEKLLSAEPISSPCGRTAFRPPLGPSAIPTDQILIMKEKTEEPTTNTNTTTTTTTAPVGESQEKLLSAEPISSPCGRTAFRPPLGPSAIPTDQILIMKEKTEDQDVSTAHGERPTSSMSMSMDSSTNTYEYRSRAEESMSGDSIPTAVPIGSPCGRTRFHVPLGPSAIPTDQIMIFDAQTTTGDSLGSTTTEFSAAAENIEHSPQRIRTASPIGTPCGRTKFQVPLGPSATPTDQILRFEEQVTTRTVVPNVPGSLYSTAKDITNFTPLTAALGNQPLTGFDQDQWNLARNDTSDPNITNMKTAREPSEVRVQSEKEKKAFSRSPLSPIANTARLPSGDTLFKESEMQMNENANQKKENDQMQQIPSQSPIPQETTPEGLPQVEVIKLWPRDVRMSPTLGVVTAREWMMSPTPGVSTAQEIPTSPTTGVTTAAEIADSIAQIAQAPPMSPASQLHTAHSSHYDAATIPDILDSSTLGAVEENEISNNNLIPMQVTIVPGIQSSLGESMKTESDVRERTEKSTRPSLFGRNSRLLRPISITPVLPQTNLKSPATSQAADSQAQTSSVPSSVPSLPSISSAKAFQSAGRGQRLGHSTTGGSALSRLLRARSSSGFRSEKNPPSARLRRSIPEDANRKLGRGSSTADANNTPAFSSSTASRFGFSATRQGSASGMSTTASNFGRRIRPSDGYPSSTQEPSSRSVQPLSEAFGHRLPSSRFGLPPAPEGWKERLSQRRNLLASKAGTGGLSQQDGQALNTAQESSLRSTPFKIRKTPSERLRESSVKTARPIRSKTLRRRPKPVDNRPSYYGAQGKIKKINKRNLRKPVRMARETNFEEDTTQKQSPDAQSDKRVANATQSPRMKTAVGYFDEVGPNEDVKPAEIIIHEQDADGSFKLELHMACNMTSTGRLNLSGRAPAGLIPKRVSVNGKEIWIAS